MHDRNTRSGKKSTTLSNRLDSFEDSKSYDLMNTNLLVGIVFGVLLPIIGYFGFRMVMGINSGMKNIQESKTFRDLQERIVEEVADEMQHNANVRQAERKAELKRAKRQVDDDGEAPRF